jgi:RimJ/RimL family protein N-acetyltransferase
MQAAFQPIHTARLTIRRFQAADAPALAAYRGLPAVAIYQSWDSFTLTDATALIKQMITLHSPTTGEWFQFAVVLRESNTLIGDLATHLQPQQAEIGFSFDPQFWGQGLANEAVRALLAYAFSDLALHRVYASTDPRNSGSIKLLERLGMRREAHHLQSLWFKDTWADDLVYAMLEREWLALQESGKKLV